MSATATEDFVPFFRPSFSEAEEGAVLRVLRSGWLTTGKEALAFEEEFARFVSSPHALAVNSASSGLMLAMDALGVGPGKKVLTTPYTFVSTATAAIHLGAEVVYADVEPGGYNIDPARVEEALDRDPAIAAVVPVHIAGNPCRMREILEIARARSIPVIEDAAHAFPARTPDGFAGTIADAGVFSFYATKTITTGEGGMITCRDDGVAARVKTLRSHGIDRTVWDRYTSKQASWVYDVVDAGWKCNLPDILAAIGREQLKKADGFLERRARVVRAYNEAFGDLPFLTLPPDSPGNAWHLYLARIRGGKDARDRFAKTLQDGGIGISVHFIPHFEMSYFKKRYGISRSDFPEAARSYEATVTLPLWPDMSDRDVERVIDAVRKAGSAL